MTEYDYSPEAWEQHLAKQASIAEWSAQYAQPDSHQYTNPFKPTPEEIARKQETEFYSTSDGRWYEGPDRPPTPTQLDFMMASAKQAQASSSASSPSPVQQQQQQQYYPPGYTSPSAQAALASLDPSKMLPGTRILVPRWNGKAWVYEEHGRVSSAGTVVTMAASRRSSSRPSPKRSQTVPVGVVYPGSQQQQYYYQAQPNSGNSIMSGKTVESGSSGYTYPSVPVGGAPPPKKAGSSKLKKRERTGDGR